MTISPLSSAFLILGLAAFDANAQPVIKTVGSDGACQFSTIQAALNSIASAFGSTEIRIARNQSYNAQALTIPFATLSLVGGFDNCSSTTPSTTNTTLNGDNVNPVINVPDCTAPCDRGFPKGLDLKDITIRQGRPGLRVRRALFPLLQGVVFENNNDAGGLTGGAIDLDAVTLSGGDFAEIGLVIDGFTIVRNNISSADGAGIRCRNARVSIKRDALIQGNTALGKGGGIFADSGCILTLSAGGFFRGVVGNSALEGGGVYAASRSRVLIQVDRSSGGTATLPDINGNSASNGGAALSSRDANIRISAGNFIDNDNAGSQGLAAAIVHIGNQSDLNSSFSMRSIEEDAALCPDLACIRIRDSDNSISAAASFGPFCSALYARDPRTMALIGVRIENNQLNAANRGDLTAVSAAVCLESTKLSGTPERPFFSVNRNQIIKNGGTPHALVVNDIGGSGTLGATLTVRQNTIASNVLTTTPTSSITSSFYLGPDTPTTIENNIFMDSGATWIERNTVHPEAIAPVVDLNLGLSGAPASSSGGALGLLQTFLATFNNTNSNDFSLLLTGLNFAIDGAGCLASTPLDINFQRVFDFSSITNVTGPCDLGADELSPLIFINGFE